MLVVVPLTLTAAGPGDGPHCVSIVETHKTLAGGVMKGQRVVQTMRPFLCWRYPLDGEFHPMVAGRIDNQHLAVKL
jgi:hypothetical protein